jgi:hypothetical protein
METVNLPRDSSLLSAANKLPIEQREPTLCFERTRIPERIHIVHDAQLHLVACDTKGKQRTNDQNAGKLLGQTGNRR